MRIKAVFTSLDIKELVIAYLERNGLKPVQDFVTELLVDPMEVLVEATNKCFQTRSPRW